MKLPVRFLLVAVVSIVLLAGCLSAWRYSGDGHLTDGGPLAATEGTKTFWIANLPIRNFVAGIEIRVAPEDLAIIEKLAVNPTVSLELSGPGGEVVFTKKSELAMWDWSMGLNIPKAFIYGRGEPGTYFDPLPQTEYALTFTVHEPDPGQSKYTARLLAKSGGWK
jgi:hypothetical protein